ncbi:CDP-diacylglycerol--glycerol-3-phosphate 3-phosphatidyltransferase [Alkaliphilus transvaalensis]|uniref:CDP-diacylglycerol--glycerol-3-phosphate 3-phosphatidyltransferase n=1 Tax=Alkaliphilus transvaalensis TaxID=114628 RepID=UPI0006852CAF|nr:CDP-diacylglycerol--glycerol-3-phosphate 3-phosphatidyltransferase [Alkaliphilus transvaalensis]
MNLPNILTASRFLLIPFFVSVFFSDSPNNIILAIVIFVVAGITDMLDGYLARKHGLITKWGQAMDPLADKLMLLTVLVCFTIKRILPPWVIIIVALKETLMVIGGLLLYTRKDKTVLPANKLGKLATVIFYIAIIWKAFEPVYGGFLVIVAVAVTAIAFIKYVNLGLKIVNKKDEYEKECEREYEKIS